LTLLSVIIPAYNEEKRIAETLSSLLDFRKRSHEKFEIVVVDDGSDATSEIVRGFAKKTAGVRVFHYAERLGKGGALTEGLRSVKGAVLLYDADGACAPEEAFRLVHALENNDVAIASRYLPGSKTGGVTAGRFFASRVLNVLVRVLFGLPISDSQCGFKAMRFSVVKKISPQLFSKGFVWDIEFLYRARKAGFKIAEIPVEWKHVPAGPLESDSVVRIAFKMLRDLFELRFKLFSRA